MKFLCTDCQQLMDFVDNQRSEDGGSMAIRYRCPECGRGFAMVTNPGETQLVHSLGVTIGHESLTEQAPQPMAMVRESLQAGQADFDSTDRSEPEWSEAALKRLSAAPSFVQGMIRRLYTDWARQQGYHEITPAVMNEARQALGMTEF